MKTDTKIIIIPDFMIVLKAMDKAKNETLTDVQIDTKITYSHLHKIKNILLDRKLINTTQQGTGLHIELTNEGRQLLVVINELLRMLNILLRLRIFHSAPYQEKILLRILKTVEPLV